MTVAFDFDDKKEEEDNSGKVKVSSVSLCFCLSDRLSLSEVSEHGGYMRHQGFIFKFCKASVNRLAAEAPPTVLLIHSQILK